MPAPATTDDLLDLVRKSGLIEPERLGAFVSRLADGAATEPRELVSRLVGAGLLTNFQGEQFLLGKWRGFTIGKYKVLERLGSGGMGTVYLCEHLVVRRKVAVKVLPASKADNPSALGRFYREARAAGVLDHPNLVKAHDIDQDGGLHFLIMDYIDGSNLQEVVTRFGPFSVERAAHYTAQAAAGLQHAHDSGLIHRDVKPANILLDRAGTIRVLDLGLARFSDPTDQLTLKYDDKNVLGTADYVSPEQALNSHEVDTRADVYSLGATLYFCLTGQPPFPGGKIAQKLIWHQVKEPTPVLQLRPDLPEALAAVVTRMMAKDPAQRYQSPAEVIEALAPWTALPLAPPPDEEMPRLSPAVAGARDGERGPTTPPYASRPPALGARGSMTQNRGGGAPTPAAQADVATPRVLASQAATEIEARGPQPAPPVRPSELLPAGQTLYRSYGPLWALRIAAILAAGAVMGMCLRWSITRWRAAAQPAPGPATLVVSQGGEPGTFATVRDALRRARPGDRVEVRADVWQEALELADGAGNGVRLEGRAPGGQPVLWRAPPGHQEDRPLVEIAGVSGLRLSGFTFDGQERLKALVSLTGTCAGLRLEDVTLRGFAQSAVAMHRCRGEEGRPVVLRRVRATPGRRATAALLLEGRGDELCRHLHVSGCRLEGPYQAAVLLSGPASDLTFDGNRVFNATDGLRARKGAEAHRLVLTVSGNTFCDIEKVGVHFEASPAGGSRVTLTNNLFARTGTLARVGDLGSQPKEGAASRAAQLFPEPSGNFRDLKSQEGFPLLKAVAHHFELPTEGDDATFLRYPRSSPLTLVGSPGVPPAARR